MDFADLDVSSAADSGATLHIEHPTTGEPLFTEAGKPITVRVKGADSKSFRQEMHRLAEAQAGKRQKVTRAKAETNAIELLASVTIGWDGIVWEGEPLKFSEENARMLYRERPWLREQVDEFIADRANFFKDA